MTLTTRVCLCQVTTFHHFGRNNITKYTDHGLITPLLEDSKISVDSCWAVRWLRLAADFIFESTEQIEMKLVSY